MTNEAIVNVPESIKKVRFENDKLIIPKDLIRNLKRRHEKDCLIAFFNEENIIIEFSDPDEIKLNDNVLAFDETDEGFILTNIREKHDKLEISDDCDLKVDIHSNFIQLSYLSITCVLCNNETGGHYIEVFDRSSGKISSYIICYHCGNNIYDLVKIHNEKNKCENSKLN